MGTGSKTVAIWGSCVSRDAFAVQSRSAELEQRLPLLYYGARSSWISQDSQPWPDPAVELGGGVSGFGRRMVEEDLSKTIVDRLVEHQPDVLLLDLVDERLQLARIGKTWFTASDYLKQTDLGPKALAQAEEVSAATQPGRPKMFAAAVGRVARRLLRELPNTTFVLNEAPYVARIGNGTELGEPQAGWARELDDAQRPMMRSLIQAFGPRLIRATPPEQVRLADPDHRWGISSYHYVEDYYHWLIDTLLDLPAVDPAAAGGPGSPSRWGRSSLWGAALWERSGRASRSRSGSDAPRG